MGRPTTMDDARAVAERRYRAVLERAPGDVGALEGLGLLLAELGRYDEAMPLCEQALARDPDSLAVGIALGTILQAHGRPEDALACLEAALARAPDATAPLLAKARIRVAQLLLQRGDLEAACAALRLALASRPDDAELQCHLGVALLRLERPGEAIDWLARAVALKPGMAAAHNARGAAWAALGRHDDALGCYRATLASAPNSADAQHNVGTALAALGREDEALAAYDAALALDPAHAGALANKGNALKTLGRLDAARGALARAIALDPLAARAYLSLAECGPVRADDLLRGSLEALLRDHAAMPSPDRMHLHFALAKAYDDAAEPAKAFEQLCAANALKRRTVAYDEAATLAELETLRTLFTPAFLRSRAGSGVPGATPVFIVGMPRSGTTLVEQILASHPQVFGAGEIECLPEAIAVLTARAAGALPARLAALGTDGWRALGENYLRAIRALAPAAARITDKRPLNFAHVGLIHLALPEARIVHVRRDPLDTCLSCFAKLFGGDQPFAYDLGELGRYYRAYDGLMAHWRRVLPEGVMLELQYEALVADLEPQARRLLAHCGLAWDAACLAFHQAARPVRTASVVQVRQQLYRDAVGRAARYRRLLGRLIEALAGAAGPPAGGRPVR
jgi:tetratricopeptide (TPR) repeat protein